MKKSQLYWNIAYWILGICWVSGAILTMNRFQGGFLTNYLSDLTFPPFYYIFLRGLRADQQQVSHFLRWFGRSPEHTSVSIFMVGVIAEISSIYWPRGFFGGTFDPIDILAYAVGLVICYCFDKRELNRH